MIIAYIISFILFLTVIITFKLLLNKQQQYFLKEVNNIKKMYRNVLASTLEERNEAKMKVIQLEEQLEELIKENNILRGNE